ncbi:MAG: hypothetical protein AB7E60_06990 [Sphingobium sp.]
MWDFSISRSIDLMIRTMPFLLLRLAVYGGIALAYVLVSAVGAGIGYGVGAVGDPGGGAGGAVLGGFLGFSIVGAVMFWAREYLLYLVKAGHIAVLVELIDGRPLPSGRGQVDHGKTVVKARFAQASALFALDVLVKGVLRSLTGLVGAFLSFLPGAKQLRDLLRAFLRVAVGFIDEVILAHAIRTQSDNSWGSAREALVLYGQNWKTMFRNAAWLLVIVYGLGFLIFLAMLAPASLLVYWMPGAFSLATLVFALLFAWCIKTAVLEPFAVACLMQVWFRATDGQQPDAEWDVRLEQMSGHFRKLKSRALGAT